MSGAIMLRKIRSRGVDVHLPDEEALERQGKDIKWILDLLTTEAVPWDIANVVRYLDSMGNDKRHDISVRELPCVLPPFPLLWFESPIPASPDWHIIRKFSAQRFGVFVRTIDLEWDGARDYVMEQFAHCGIPRDVTARARFALDATWFLDMLEPATDMPTTVVGPHVQLFTVLDDQGGWSCHDGGRALISCVPISDSFVRWHDDAIGVVGESKRDVVAQAMAYISRDFMLPVWFAISLSHCSNVSLTENSGRYLNRQERRRAELKGEPPAIKYYTLEIGGITRALNTEGNAKQDGLKKALHICRGHFATYSEDKPLFGKYAGRFWIPAHVRGSTEAGQVVKDYRVKAPAA